MCMKDEKMQKGIRNVIFRSLFAHLTTMAASKLDQRGPPIREHMNQDFSRYQGSKCKYLRKTISGAHPYTTA